jgi:hypothetical protein
MSDKGIQYGGSGPALTAHGSLELEHNILIQIQLAALPYK